MAHTAPTQVTDKKIILNWMPPASINWPSPAMSVLKGYLTYHHYNVDIEYWNLRLNELQYEFRWGEGNSSDNATNIYLLYNYLAVTRKDLGAYQKIKAHLKVLRPQYINVSNDFFDEHMQKYADKVDAIFEEVIGAYDFSNILFFGLEANLYQWICSSIIAEKIKKHCPSAITVIGGIGTRNAAVAYLKNFPQFDIAMWGEGEAPLLHLTNIIRERAFDQLPYVENIAYRKNSAIETSKVPNNNYVDLSDASMKPDYADFYNLTWKYGMSPKDLNIPFEGSRSCHWKKCHFCYLNNGYKFRAKSVDILCEEIDADIDKFGVKNIMFLDNDVIINDFKRFDDLLDGFIKIRNKYPQFGINGSEVVTKGLNAAFIKKMALAGFKSVQIGYESPSDNLLRKIDKKNTFSSNLLFIKFAQKYKIAIVGANVICYLYEETDDDIIESINNIHFLRFYYANGFFKHSLSRLAITESSPYYRRGMVGGSESMEIDYIALFLPQGYIRDDTKLSLFEYSLTDHNTLWDKFAGIDNHYTKHLYTYDFIGCDGKVEYIEYYDNVEINHLELEQDSLEWEILTHTNHEVMSADSLLERMIEKKPDITRDNVIEAINALSAERLVYHNADYSENVAVVDVERTM